MNNITTENKGTIKLGSKVMVSDPCYGLNTWCQGVLNNVLPGKYECQVEYSDEGDWGIRVSAIQVVHEDFKGKQLEFIDPEDFEVGVDSGMAGIFDYEYYAKYHSDCKDKYHVDDHWYDGIYNKTSECITNPDYVPFVDTPEYKAGLLAYKHDLDELSNNYPELDVMSIYMDLINEYHSLENRKPSLDLDSIINTLRDLNKLLEKKEFPDEILEVATTALEKTKGETELFELQSKYERNMNNLWLAYRGSVAAHKQISRSTGGTIDGLGFVSSSGYGDGGYDCWTAENDDGEIVAIRVEFITEDYDEEE